MNKKSSIFLAIVFVLTVSSSLAFATEDKGEKLKEKVITRTSIADCKFPKRFWEDSATEAVEKKMKAAVIAEKVQHVDYVDGEIIIFSAGTLVDWQIMQEYLIIEYDPVEKFAKGTLNVPIEVFLKYLGENVYPGAIPVFYLDEMDTLYDGHEGNGNFEGKKEFE